LAKTLTKVIKASFIIFIWQMSREGFQNDKKSGLAVWPAHASMALLSLTHKSNFHIFTYEKGEFRSAPIKPTPIEWSMYDGASALGTLYEAHWFAPNF
jgi:hypothetical protein